MSVGLLGYQGKTVAVTGAATGMGRETTALLIELGAKVHALDIAPIELPAAQKIRVDLSDEASIDAAVSKLPDRVDCLFSCAGISRLYLGKTFSTVHVNLVNFVGQRHLVESVIPRLPRGGAIALIASIAGKDWAKSRAKIDALLATSNFDEARAWLDAHVNDPETLGGDPRANRDYMFSKECVVVYAKQRAWDLGAGDIRINTLSPGIVETPMLASFNAIHELGDPKMRVAWPSVGRISVPREQAEAIVFLNSNMARYVSGVDLPCDYGFVTKDFSNRG